jgi:hypothetical protein
VSVPRFIWIPAVLALLSFSASALAQKGVPAQQSRGDAVRVTAFPKGMFRLSSGKLAANVNLRDQLSGCWSGTYDGSDPNSRPSGGEAQTRVIDLVRKSGAWYLTFQATLQGGCNVQGMCGAGTDTTLIWLKLTPALKMVGRQAEVIEDCAGNVSIDHYTGMKAGQTEPSETRLELQGGLLEVVPTTPTSAPDTTTYTTVRYQHAFPEQGLKVSSKQAVRD